MVYLLLQICLLRRSAVERASDPTSSVENPIGPQTRPLDYMRNQPENITLLLETMRAALAPRPPPPRQSRRTRARAVLAPVPGLPVPVASSLVWARGRRALLVQFVLAAWCGRAN
jgi:hypothetical protein